LRACVVQVLCVGNGSPCLGLGFRLWCVWGLGCGVRGHWQPLRAVIVLNTVCVCVCVCVQVQICVYFHLYTSIYTLYTCIYIHIYIYNIYIYIYYHEH